MDAITGVLVLDKWNQEQLAAGHDVNDVRDALLKSASKAPKVFEVTAQTRPNYGE